MLRRNAQLIMRDSAICLNGISSCKGMGESYLLTARYALALLKGLHRNLTFSFTWQTHLQNAIMVSKYLFIVFYAKLPHQILQAGRRNP